MAARSGLLGNDVNVHRRRIAQKFVDGGQIEILSPALLRRAPEHDLRDVLLAHHFRHSSATLRSLGAYDCGPQVFGEANVLRQGALVFGVFVAPMST